MEILKLANPLSIAAYPRIKQPNPPLGIIYQHANPMIYFCTGRFWRLKIKCFGAVGHFLLYMDNTGRNRIYFNAPLGASLNIDKYACACKQHAQNRKNHIYIYIYIMYILSGQYKCSHHHGQRCSLFHMLLDSPIINILSVLAVWLFISACSWTPNLLCYPHPVPRSN